jgi:hypothetical protein
MTQRKNCPHRGIVAALFLGLAPLAASAATLEERVQALENRDAELYATLEEKKAAGLMTKIGERLSISGLIEVEAYYERLNLRTEDDESSSDLVLATAQLGFEAVITEHLSAALVFLFEEDETDPPEVDEVYVAYSRAGWFSRLGQQYVPFGEYPSHFISDPLTLELGETRETALLVGYQHELFSVSAFAFNGDAERVDGGGDPEEDHLKDWGLSAKVLPAAFLELGVSFLSDLADTDTELAGEYRDRVAGWSAFALARFAPVEVSGEVLGAVGSFDAADLDGDGDGSGDRPLAWNVELAWDLWEAVELATRLEGSRELAGAPQLQYGANASWEPWEHVSVSVEYLHGKFDDDFGVGEDDRKLDSRDLFTTRLAVEF